MRFLPIIAVLWAAALSTHAATPAQDAELHQLEHRAQTLARDLSLQTTREDVLKALGLEYWGGNQPCTDHCIQQWDLTGDETAIFRAHLFYYSSKMNSDNYRYDRPFEPEEARVTVSLKPETSPDLCFSPEAWNDSLTQAGWPPLTRSTVTRTLGVSNATRITDRRKPKRTDVAVTVFETRLGTKTITLSSAPDIYRRYLVSTKQLKAALALGDCARVVTMEVE